MFSTSFLVMIVREIQIICVLALKVFWIWLKSYASLSFDNCFPLHSSCHEFCIRKGSLLGFLFWRRSEHLYWFWLCFTSLFIPSLLLRNLHQNIQSDLRLWHHNSSCLHFHLRKCYPDFQVLLQINLSFIFSFFLPLSLFISFLFFLSIFSIQASSFQMLVLRKVFYFHDSYWGY